MRKKKGKESTSLTISFLRRHFYDVINSILTDNNELDPDLLRPEAVDGLAREDAGVVLVGVLDLERLPAGQVTLPHEVDLLAVLAPLDDGRREPGDGADQPHGLADAADLLQLLLLGLRRTCNGRDSNLEQLVSF